MGQYDILALNDPTPIRTHQTTQRQVQERLVLAGGRPVLRLRGTRPYGGL